MQSHGQASTNVQGHSRSKRARNPSALAIQSLIVDDFFEEHAPKKRRGRPPGRKATTPTGEMDRPPEAAIPEAAVQSVHPDATPHILNENTAFQMSSINALMGSEPLSALPRSVFGTSESTHVFCAAVQIILCELTHAL